MESSLRSAFSLRLRCLRTPAASSMKPRRSSGVACRIVSSWPWPTITCISRPMPESLSSSWTSSSRHGVPLMAYSEPPERNIVRLIVTSEYSIGSAPSELSMVSSTSARPSGGRPDVPAKMTSSILPPRRLLAPCSPITQARASTTLDLPEPLGPTMQVMPGSSCSVVDDAKDLNPLRVRLFRYNGAPHGAATTMADCRCSGCRAGEVQRAHPTQHHPRSRASGRGVGGRSEAEPRPARRGSRRAGRGSCCMWSRRPWNSSRYSSTARRWYGVEVDDARQHQGRTSVSKRRVTTSAVRAHRRRGGVGEEQRCRSSRRDSPTPPPSSSGVNGTARVDVHRVDVRQSGSASGGQPPAEGLVDRAEHGLVGRALVRGALQDPRARSRGTPGPSARWPVARAARRGRRRAAPRRRPRRTSGAASPRLIGGSVSGGGAGRAAP